MDFINILPRAICDDIFEYLHPLYLWVVTNRVNKAWNKYSIDLFYETFEEHIDLEIRTDSWNSAAATSFYDIYKTEYWKSYNTELYLDGNEMYCRFYFHCLWATDIPEYSTSEYKIEAILWYSLYGGDLRDAGCCPLFDEYQTVSLEEFDEEIESNLVDEEVTSYYSVEEISENRCEINLTCIEMPLKVLLGWQGCLKVDREFSELLDFVDPLLKNWKKPFNRVLQEMLAKICNKCRLRPKNAKKCNKCRLRRKNVKKCNKCRSRFKSKYCSVHMCASCCRKNGVFCRKHRRR